MGIRFLCDACGKKLNIKEDLAGKKGRCPKCNARIEIPTESTLDEGSTGRKSEEQKTGVPHPAPEATVETGADSSTPSRDTGQPDHPSEVKPDGGPTTPSAADDAPPSPPPLPPGMDSEAEEAAPETAQKDVFSENPAAKWYVRPSSGGQFGPAESDVMKNWLKEGRVGKDSLVWCEGWDDWQNAAEIFESELQLSPGEPETPHVPPTQVGQAANPSSVAAPTENPGQRIMNHQLKRRRAKTMGILLVVGLAIVSITLAVVLFFVVSGNRNREKNQDKKESASLSFEGHKNHNPTCILKPGTRC